MIACVALEYYPLEAFYAVKSFGTRSLKVATKKLLDALEAPSDWLFRRAVNRVTKHCARCMMRSDAPRRKPKN